VRTTLTIDDDLYRMTKALAEQRGCSVSSVVEDSLREAIDRLGDPALQRQLPVLSQSGGTLAGVDLEDRRALRQLLNTGANSSALP